MYVIVILKTNLLTLIAKEDSYIFSDGKGNGNTWADRDKISLYAGFHYDLGENKKSPTIFTDGRATFSNLKTKTIYIFEKYNN